MPASEKSKGHAAQTIVSFTPRAWWAKSVPQDGYIHKNIPRHLAYSGQGIELVSLLLDARWTTLRETVGGILALQTDFESFGKCSEESEGSTDLEACNVGRSLKQIFKAVLLSWGRMSEGLRVFYFHVSGRLLSLRKKNVLVEAYLKSLEGSTPKPYLVPLSPFFPDLSDAQVMEIPVGGECECVASSSCGRFIAAGAGHQVVVAQENTGEILQRLKGHVGVVRCIAFSAGSRILVSGSWDGKVIVWEWDTSDLPARVLDGHLKYVTGVAISSDGNKIFSSSRDETIRIWNVNTGDELRVLHQSHWVACIALSRDDQKIAVGLIDGRFNVLDVLKADQKAADAMSKFDQNIAVSHIDGKLNVLYALTADQKAARYTLKSKKKRPSKCHRLNSHRDIVLLEDWNAHDDFVDCASFSPNGQYLVTGSFDKTLRLWNAATWKVVGERLEGHKKWVTSVAWNPNGKTFASGSADGTIRVWDVESRGCVGVSAKVPAVVESVCFTPDGKKILSGWDDGVVRICDANLGTESKLDSYGHSDSVYGVSISLNGSRVASASMDGTVLLWDSQTGDPIDSQVMGHSGKVNCVSFCPDGRKLVSGSDDTALQLWNTETCIQVGKLDGGKIGISWCIAFSFDGLRIVSGSFDNKVRLWDAETHKQIGGALLGNKEPVRCVSESFDGCYVVSRDFMRRTIIWNRRTRAIVWKSEKNQGMAACHMTDRKAEKIIRSCGQNTPHLWPSSFPTYSAELYCEEGSVYSNTGGNKILIGNIFSSAEWKYNSASKVLAAGLCNGTVAICKLITE